MAPFSLEHWHNSRVDLQQAFDTAHLGSPPCQSVRPGRLGPASAAPRPSTCQTPTRWTDSDVTKDSRRGSGVSHEVPITKSCNATVNTRVRKHHHQSRPWKLWLTAVSLGSQTAASWSHRAAEGAGSHNMKPNMLQAAPRRIPDKHKACKGYVKSLSFNWLFLSVSKNKMQYNL